MKNTKFIVVFTNHNYEQVFAVGKQQAVILAQAKQIHKGNSYNVAFVKDEKGRIV